MVLLEPLAFLLARISSDLCIAGADFCSHWPLSTGH